MAKRKSSVYAPESNQHYILCGCLPTVGRKAIKQCYPQDISKEELWRYLHQLLGQNSTRETWVNLCTSGYVACYPLKDKIAIGEIWYRLREAQEQGKGEILFIEIYQCKRKQARASKPAVIE